MIKRIFKKRVETRALPRIRLYNFVKYRLSSQPASDFAIANVRDISGSGLLFIAKRELSKNAVLEVGINFPGIEPISVQAIIVRVSRTFAGEYEIGAAFIRIDEARKKELAERIDFILKKIAAKRSILGRLRHMLK